MRIINHFSAAILVFLFFFILCLSFLFSLSKVFRTDVLNELCSIQDQLDLLNFIDRFRSQDISNYVSLSQIIVCGDQSSEKSSVLKAITGVSFSIKSNLWTRFPMELVFRKTSHIRISVSIISHHFHSAFERLFLDSLHKKLNCFNEFSTLIENAKTVMKISTHDKTFSKNFLRIEISDSDQFHLIIINLFELIHFKTKQ